MSRRGLPTQILSVLLVGALQAATLAAAAPPTGVVHGTVLDAPSRAPLAGARLHLADPQTGAIFSSEPTGAEGAFRVAGLPPATYEVAVESGPGLFVVGSPVAVAAGDARRVDVAVRRDAAMGINAAAGATAGRRSVWNNPLMASMVVLTSAFLVGAAINEATDDDDKPPPTTPF